MSGRPAFFLLLLSVALACSPEKNSGPGQASGGIPTDSTFDRELWSTRRGGEYPFREQMLRDVVYNDTIRRLNREQLLSLLGDPDRENEGHLYYTISEKKLGFLTLSLTSMVVRLRPDGSVEWIRIYNK